MFKKPQDRHPLLYVMESLAGMGWFLATDSVCLYLLESEWPIAKMRAETEFDSAEFEFIRPQHEAHVGTLSSIDLQWTKADVKQTSQAIELDAMRCRAGMYALAQFYIIFRLRGVDLDLTIQWDEHQHEYSVFVRPMTEAHEPQYMPRIFVLTPNFEVTAMIPMNR